MATEADCTLRIGDRTVAGHAVLAPDALHFIGEPGGELAVTIPFTEVRHSEARRGELTVVYAGGTAVFTLGREAAPWQLKIRYPSPLLDKLGVKPGMAVAALGIRDALVLADLAARATMHPVPAPVPLDVLLYGFATDEELAELEVLRPHIARNGAIWAIYPKGRKELREIDVIAGAKTAGLVDIKVVSFSPTHTGLKLVIPVALR
ncbi:MAG: hypothetical protein QOF51_1549 [Chloroflexota bacterium]|jgi:hypothetical protein|nr:hypothetical protein [Chloroflexota bacterium]